MPETGSSPRVRGTRWPARSGCAGCTVHPRVCGEHAKCFDDIVPNIGSSPRVRGTLRPWLAKAVSKRFIPACAGNTCSSRAVGPPASVHPRVCGEHSSQNDLNSKHYFAVKETTNQATPILPSSARSWKCRCSGAKVDGKGHFRPKGNKTQAIKINRDPAVLATGVKFKPRVVGCCPRNNCVAVFNIGTDLPPYHLTHTSPITANINSGAYFQQPYSQPSA